MNEKKQIKPIEQNQSVGGLRKLTPKNWLFIKYYLETSDAKIAYMKAGYKGKSFAAPYEMVYYLSHDIKMIAENNGIGHANLMIRTKGLIDKPLVRATRDGNEVSITGLTPTEHLRALEFARKLTDKKEKESTRLSPVIIKTESNGQTMVNIGTKGPKTEDSHKDEGTSEAPIESKGIDVDEQRDNGMDGGTEARG